MSKKQPNVLYYAVIVTQRSMQTSVMCNACLSGICTNRCDMEVKQIEGTPYQISSCGMVWKVENEELIRQKTYLGGKTLYVNMWHFGGKLKVAELVLKAFQVYGGGRVVYKDGNYENCSLENLKWSRSLEEEIEKVQKYLDQLKNFSTRRKSSRS